MRYTKSKYGNRKIKTDEGIFDSKREFDRWNVLKLLQRRGEITNLRRQEKFVIIPSQFENEIIRLKTKTKTVARCVEKECAYYADFVYDTSEGETVVEDSKGAKTEVYRIKKKLMLERHGIKIREV